MYIGNRSDVARAVKFGEQFITIQPMSFVTLEDNGANKDALNRLMKTETFRRWLDAGVLVVDQTVSEREMPVTHKTPEPPAELLAAPSNAKVTKGTPSKTNETMAV